MSEITLEDALSYSVRSTDTAETKILWLATAMAEHFESESEPAISALLCVIIETMKPDCDPQFVRNLETIASLNPATAARH